MSGPPEPLLGQADAETGHPPVNRGAAHPEFSCGGSDCDAGSGQAPDDLVAFNGLDSGELRARAAYQGGWQVLQADGFRAKSCGVNDLKELIDVIGAVMPNTS